MKFNILSVDMEPGKYPGVLTVDDENNFVFETSKIDITSLFTEELRDHVRKFLRIGEETRKNGGTNSFAPSTLEYDLSVYGWVTEDLRQLLIKASPSYARSQGEAVVGLQDTASQFDHAPGSIDKDRVEFKAGYMAGFKDWMLENAPVSIDELDKLTGTDKADRQRVILSLANKAEYRKALEGPNDFSQLYYDAIELIKKLSEDRDRMRGVLIANRAEKDALSAKVEEERAVSERLSIAVEDAEQRCASAVEDRDRWMKKYQEISALRSMEITSWGELGKSFDKVTEERDTAEKKLAVIAATIYPHPSAAASPGLHSQSIGRGNRKMTISELVEDSHIVETKITKPDFAK